MLELMRVLDYELRSSTTCGNEHKIKFFDQSAPAVSVTFHIIKKNITL